MDVTYIWTYTYLHDNLYIIIDSTIKIPCASNGFSHFCWIHADSSKIGYGGEAYIADQKLFEMDRNIDAICSICQLLKIIPNVSGLEKLQSPQILCVHNQRSKLLSM